MWRFVTLLVKQHLSSFGCANSVGLLCPHSATRVHPAVMPDYVCINCYNFGRTTQIIVEKQREWEKLAC